MTRLALQPLTRRYIGTFYSTTAGNGQIEDSFANRYLWNYYNRVVRPMRNADESAAPWNYTTNTTRQANANTANQLNFVVGVNEDPVISEVYGAYSNTTAGVVASNGIGLDTTAAYTSGSRRSYAVTNGVNFTVTLVSALRVFSGVGKHFLSWNEISQASGTTTFYAQLVGTQAGISGELIG
jgi:hypothetical protein